jgi:hypothetical protein
VAVGVPGRLSVDHGAHDGQKRAAGREQRDLLVGTLNRPALMPRSRSRWANGPRVRHAHVGKRADTRSSAGLGGKPRARARRRAQARGDPRRHPADRGGKAIQAGAAAPRGPAGGVRGTRRDVPATTSALFLSTARSRCTRPQSLAGDEIGNALSRFAWSRKFTSSHRAYASATRRSRNTIFVGCPVIRRGLCVMPSTRWSTDEAASISSSSPRSERRVDVERARARRVDMPRVVSAGAGCAAMTLVLAMELSSGSLGSGCPSAGSTPVGGDKARVLPTCVRRHHTGWTISRPPQRLAAGLSRGAFTQFA